MNQYITNNKPNENLIYVLDYLGISIDEFLEMSDDKIISIYKKSADALNDGVMTKSGALKPYKENHQNASSYKFEREKNYTSDANSGSKSRYFDIDVWGEKHGLLQFPKASKRERNEGCEGLERKQTKGGGGGIGDYLDDVNSMSGKYGSEKAPAKNHHPTVKPVHLMSWLVRLVSKEGDVVLDPFAGSGTTGVACNKLNRNFIGIEKDEQYFKIAEQRINTRTLFS